jgi:hypothetical protein
LPLGATPLRFVELIGGQVLLAGTLGARTYRSLFALGSAATACATVLAAAIGAIVIARALATASAQLRLLVLFATLVLAAILWSPVVAAPLLWEALRIPDTATRYYVLPIVAYLACLLWLACRERCRALRVLARALLALVVVAGVPLDWRITPRPDLDFPGQVARYRAAPPGTLVKIPIPPDGWEMQLWKR